MARRGAQAQQAGGLAAREIAIPGLKVAPLNVALDLAGDVGESVDGAQRLGHGPA
ncbi:MAG: hypothetical protein ACKOEM_14435 [Planctomycetia bacterium]